MSTTSGGWLRDVACGNDPEAAFLRAMAELPHDDGECWVVATKHDQGCPALERGEMRRCRCELVWLEARRAA